MNIFDVINSFRDIISHDYHCPVQSIVLDKESFNKLKHQCELRKMVHVTSNPRFYKSFLFNDINIVCGEDEPKVLPELEQRPKPKVCSHKNWSVQDSCMLGRVKCLDCGQEISMVTVFNNLKNDMEEVISLITNK